MFMRYFGGGLGHQRPRASDLRAEATRPQTEVAPEDDVDREIAGLEAVKANMPVATLDDEAADYGYEYSDWEDDDEGDDEDVERMGPDERFHTLSGYSV